MTELGAVILAHQDPVQVRRLIGALGDIPIVLHCDAKAPNAVADEMLRGGGGRVQALPRMSAFLSSWSLVHVELEGIRAALQQSSAEHIVVMSGADYPLAGPDVIRARLDDWKGRSFLFNAEIPYDSWSVPRHPDGGAWRFRHRFLSWNDRLITVRGIPARFPWRRPIPDGIRIRASSGWKILCREDAERLIAVVDSRPDVVRFFRSTFVPDESFIASVLSSPALTGGSVLPLCHQIPWFMHWAGRGAHHPEWLDVSFWDALKAATEVPPASPADLEPVDAPKTQALFARKVASDRSAALLDRIDTELH